MSLYIQKKKGFTVVELMVTISIIGILSTIAYASFSDAQEKSRNTKRVSDLKQVQVALEYYYAVNKSYPTTNGGYRSECPEWGAFSRDLVIPGLTPTYLPSLPSDPRMDKTANTSCYIYTSDGTNYYAFIAYRPSDLYTAPYTFSMYPELIDPRRDGGPNNSIIDGDGTAIIAWKVYSAGGVGY